MPNHFLTNTAKFGGYPLFWVGLITIACVLFAQSAHATTTLPTKMNFQGRITNSAGNILANGTYNMRFKIYDQQAPGGASQWSEDRLVSATQGVVVTNGQFNVQLGEITPLPASVFASNSRFFEIELPTPATATTSSPSWTELPMAPRSQLATSAYVYNTETLDGIDGSSFAQLSTANAFTNANSISVSSANAFQAKNGATNLFNVDTSTSTVTIGVSDTNATLFVLDTKTNAGDPGNVAGAMYYNSSTSKFRCYQGGWTDCISAGSGPSLSANNTWTGTNLFQNGTDSSSAFAVKNSTGGTLFNVDTTNAGEVTILGNSSGEVGAWQTNPNPTPVPQYMPGSVVANGYVYVVGGYGTVSVYYAKLNTDGSTGVWQSSPNTLPDDRTESGVVAANGYLYVIGGNDTVTAYNNVWYAKLNADGSIGTWRTNANLLPESRDGLGATVAANGYIYVMGGWNSSGGYRASIYYAKLNADGSIGTWQTNPTSLTSERYAGSAVVANGYVYLLGGTSNATPGVNTVLYAPINSNGSLGTWTSAPNTIPQGRVKHVSVVNNGYVYVIGGEDFSSTAKADVFYAKLNLNGSVGVWSTAANPLPGIRSGPSAVVANGYVYVINGSNPSSQTTVYYSRLGGTLKVGGNLDLVGLQGQNLADGGSASAGSTGGSITAGNITGVGSLQIQGDANFAGSATVTGNFNAGNGLFSVDTGKGTVNIGSSEQWTPAGTITYASAVNYTAGTGPYGVDLGDLDADGDKDMAVVSSGTDMLSIFLNNGNGTFATKVDYPTDDLPRGVGTADLDGDGDRDVVVTVVNTNEVAVFLNNGNGTFTTKVDYAVGTWPESVTPGDIDGDSDIDLVVANNSAPGVVSVLKNNGNGTFATKVDYTTGDDPGDVVIVDLDGDGDRDVASSNGASNNVSVLMNSGTGTFATTVNYTVGTDPGTIVNADLDGDGDQDLATGNWATHNVSVLMNSGTGTFATAVNYTVANGPERIAADDLDGDGDYELITAGTAPGVSVLPNIGNGTFATRQDFSTGATPWGVDAADLDGDGDSDLAVTNSNTTTVSVLINNTTQQSGDSGGVVLILDTKNTSGDPTGASAVAGARYYNSNLGKFRCFEGSGWLDCIGGSQKLRAASSSQSSSTTFSDVSGLTAPVVAGKTYVFTCSLIYTSAATTTALQTSINGPTSTNISYSTMTSYSATAEYQSSQTAYNTAGNPGTGGGATPYPARISGGFTTTAAGTFAVRFMSEVSGSLVTIFANSSCTIDEV